MILRLCLFMTASLRHCEVIILRDCYPIVLRMRYLSNELATLRFYGSMNLQLNARACIYEFKSYYDEVWLMHTAI